jgi:hypothetical protein
VVNGGNVPVSLSDACQLICQATCAVSGYVPPPNAVDARVNACPQVGDRAGGFGSPEGYGVPGLAQVTDPPSPDVQVAEAGVAVTVTVKPLLETEDETGVQDAGSSQYQASAFTTCGWFRPGLRCRTGGAMWRFRTSDRARASAVGGGAFNGIRIGIVIVGAAFMELSTGVAEGSQDLK